MAYRANILILVWLTNVFFKGVCYGLEFFFFIHFLSVSRATPRRLDWSQSEKEKHFEWIRQLTYRNTELRRNTGLELIIVWPSLSSLFLTENHRTQTSYDDALIIKLFGFQFVNSYTSLFYIAFFRQVGIQFGHCVFIQNH